MVYGYCRISTPKQNIDRQIRNITSNYPEAIIVAEAYTGTSMVRPKWDQLMKRVRSGDTIVFDSVSRMSRDAESGIAVYMELFKKRINLVFLKEPHINSATYNKAMQQAVPMTGTSVDCILDGINQYLLILAREQIKLAFEQAEKEVQDLRQRTREGIQTAKLNGKQVGQAAGAKLITKKSIASKEIILKHSKDFNGTLSDIDVITLAGISRNTFYLYKRQLKADIENSGKVLSPCE